MDIDIALLLSRSLLSSAALLLSSIAVRANVSAFIACKTPSFVVVFKNARACRSSAVLGAALPKLKKGMPLSVCHTSLGASAAAPARATGRRPPTPQGCRT